MVYTREYYIALKRKKILTYAITQLNFDDIMLNEISQSQKEIPQDPTYMRYLEHSESETESRIVISKGCRVRGVIV